MQHKSVDILLVEDNIDDAELTIREFKKHNIVNELFHVSDGSQALDYIFGKGVFTGRLIEQRPKLILLDIQMPKVNGIEVLEAIKADERTKTIPVVMLTSSKEDPDIQRCYQLGVNSYIVKPVNFEAFTVAIRSIHFYWLLLNEPPAK
ncbi:response regulator receiver domain-containing protein [Lacibacter cauensis]|uniref:Response regulator receiver domain-containing protein n=1 Tax=Lacibacter cauensis TaxID=510947 RepID=A0A562SWG0_9BACT|nr:response regulator [Lacibacter cauensis]TWI85324.1 response regulator receiver domain-containing protein [Lacibacter cauensis]